MMGRCLLLYSCILTDASLLLHHYCVTASLLRYCIITASLRMQHGICRSESEVHTGLDEALAAEAELGKERKIVGELAFHTQRRHLPAEICLGVVIEMTRVEIRNLYSEAQMSVENQLACSVVIVLAVEQDCVVVEMACILSSLCGG